MGERMDAPPGWAAWKVELRRPGFLVETVLSFVVLCAVIRLCVAVQPYIEARKGVALPDPILRLVGPISVPWVTFSILWSSLAVGFFFLGREPRRLVMGFQAAVLILLFRSITIYLTPLDPLPTIMPLADPLIFRFGTGTFMIKDLFFSGHTSLVFLLAVAVREPWLRIVFTAATVSVGACVLLQHVHYSIDVFVAPFFAYTSWSLMEGIHARLDPRT